METQDKLISDSNTAQASISGSDMSGQKVVAALFGTHESAKAAIDDLVVAGFGEDCVGVVARRSEPGPVVDTDTAADGATRAAIGGGIVGGLVGALLGIGLMAVPGLGWVAAGGLFATTLAGTGVGAIGGGVLGALTSMGVSEEDAESFAVGVQAGHVLVTVVAEDRSREAIQILVRNGGDLGPYRVADAPADGCKEPGVSLM